MNHYLTPDSGISRKAPQALIMRESEVQILRERVRELEERVRELEHANFLRLKELSEYRIYIQDLTTSLYCLSEAVLAGEEALAQHHAHKARQLLKVIEREV